MSEETQTLPSWLNDSFLQEIVRNVEHNPSTKLLCSKITFDTGIGDHYASTMYWATLRVKQDSIEGKEKNIHVLIKTLPDGDVTKAVLEKCEVFSREIKMFSETIPAIRRLFDTKKRTDYEDFSARHCYHTPDMTTLVVENLTPKGFKLANRQAGLDFNHSLIVMKLLGKFHASTIALRCETPELIDSFPKHPLSYDSEAINNLIKSTFKALSSVALSWPNGEFLSNRLLQRIDTFMNDFEKLFEVDPNGYNVLIHGDMWMNNLLFRYDDITSDVKQVVFVDFQFSCLNSPAIDLQNFIYTSPTEDVRAAHTEDLLTQYHKSLCHTLESLGHPEKIISFEKLMEEYEKKALQSVFSLLVDLPLVNADSNDAMDLEVSLTDSKGDDTLLKRLTGKYVTSVLKKYVPILVEKGLL